MRMCLNFRLSTRESVRCAQFVKCFGTKQVSNQRKFSFAYPELNSSLRVTSHKPTKISIRFNFQKDFKLS